MNFPPLVKAWIMLITLVVGTGAAAGTTSLLGGAHPVVAFIVGLGVGCSNVYFALAKSPSDKVTDAKNSTPSFPVSKP